MQAEAKILVASARLCQILNLDPSIRLHPTDAAVVPQPIVPDPIPVGELVAIGLLNRPELAAPARRHPGGVPGALLGQGLAVLA